MILMTVTATESHDVHFWYIKKAKVHEMDINEETKDTIRKLFLFKIGIVNKWLRKTLIHLRRSFKKANNKERNI